MSGNPDAGRGSDSPGGSDVVSDATAPIEVDEVEFPDLAELVTYADDVDAYLEQIGVSEDDILDRRRPMDMS